MFINDFGMVGLNSDYEFSRHSNVLVMNGI